MKEPSFLCKINQSILKSFAMPLGPAFNDTIDRTLILLVAANQLVSITIFDEDLQVHNSRMKPYISSIILTDQIENICFVPEVAGPHECCIYFTLARKKREIVGYNRQGLLQKKEMNSPKIIDKKVCNVTFDLASISYFREYLFFGFDNGMIISFSVKDHAFGERFNQDIEPGKLIPISYIKTLSLVNTRTSKDYVCQALHL